MIISKFNLPEESKFGVKKMQSRILPTLSFTVVDPAEPFKATAINSTLRGHMGRYCLNLRE